ncbi:hypothetical protein [Actinokineospora fastidiosa]|uniref:Uncharacterized protein n=1 Tax=Actinokineospora fastidiosa TaxID=1816 RepID=A0A918GBM7_9PSEU|nr:hypothetical protein [Actinokineospora fastidiosa]GGS27686.1 hypothetical protein GCM10010171_20580 [Actinokineospora fastidiosa]
MARLVVLTALIAALTACARPEPGAPVARATPAPTTTTTAPTSAAPTTTAPPPPSTTARATVSAPPTTTSAAVQPDIQLGEYAVTLTGTLDGQPVERPAQLSVTGTITETGTPNGVNALDVCLAAGFPLATPEAGAVWFGSNTGCFPNVGLADTDLARTSAAGATVTVDADPAVTGLNAFIGPLECLHPVSEGRMEVRFGAGGAVTGSVTARGPCLAAPPAEFTATFTGTRL